MAGTTIDTWDPAPVVSRLLAIDDSAGPNNVTVTPDDLAGQMLAEGPIKDRVEQIEASQATGDKKLAPVRILLTAATAATALTAGSTHDGLVLAAGDSVGQAIAGGSTVAGIWQVQASGAALRRTDADTGAELAKATFTVDAGTHVGTTWYVETADITIGTTPVVIKKVANAPAVTGEVVAARQGEASLAANLNKIKAEALSTTALATPAETVTGTATAKITTPAGVKAATDQWFPTTSAVPGVAAALVDGNGRVMAEVKENDGVFWAFGGITLANAKEVQTSNVAGVEWALLTDEPEPRVLLELGSDGARSWFVGDSAGTGGTGPGDVNTYLKRSSPCAVFRDAEGRTLYLFGGAFWSWWQSGRHSYGRSRWMTALNGVMEVDGAGGLVIYQMLDGSGAFECTRIGEDEDSERVDDHDNWAILIDPRDGSIIRLRCLWTPHGGNRSEFVGKSLDAKHLGPKTRIKGQDGQPLNDGNYTYNNAFFERDNFANIRCWGRTSATPGDYTWGMIRSFDGGETWTPRTKVVNTDGVYGIPSPRYDGDGDIFVCYKNPAHSGSGAKRRISAGHLRHNGQFLRLDGTQIAPNVFDPSYVPVAPETDLTEIYQPPSGSHVRLTDSRIVSHDTVAKVIQMLVCWTEWPGANEDISWAISLSKARMVTIDESGESPVVTLGAVATLGGGGEGIAIYDAPAFNPDYIAGSCVAGDGLVLYCAINVDGAGTSIAELCDISNPASVKRRRIMTTQAPKRLARPVSWIKNVYDRATGQITYQLDDFAAFAVVSYYESFGKWVADGYGIIPSEWKPE